ncbi:hypothetical protein ANN_07145 [Periplaneta americana]|uniref:Paired domain-containing protein n=1 Tax=Periplaneta americana TaxID=6978 RepID=A0ABQ8THL9_PERAM|nr:hypothetical protein ANN_07145 [Periplaneta americana]
MARNTLTMADRIKIITLMEQNMRQVDVANILHVNQSIVFRLWRKFQETQSIADRPREGRPRKATPGQDRYVRLSARRNPIASATTLRHDLREATVLFFKRFRSVMMRCVLRSVHPLAMFTGNPTPRQRNPEDIQMKVVNLHRYHFHRHSWCNCHDFFTNRCLQFVQCMWSMFTNLRLQMVPKKEVASDNLSAIACLRADRGGGRKTYCLSPHLQVYTRSVFVQVISSLMLNLWYEVKPPTAKLYSELEY